MTSSSYRYRIFGLDPIEMRERLLATTASVDLSDLLGGYAAAEEVVRKFHDTWTLVHRWSTAARSHRRAPAGTTELAIETLHFLHVDHKIATVSLAVLFDIPATRIYWYCSRWNYFHGTSREYKYKERS